MWAPRPREPTFQFWGASWRPSPPSPGPEQGWGNPPPPSSGWEPGPLLSASVPPVPGLRPQIEWPQEGGVSPCGPRQHQGRLSPAAEAIRRLAGQDRCTQPPPWELHSRGCPDSPAPPPTAPAPPRQRGPHSSFTDVLPRKGSRAAPAPESPPTHSPKWPTGLSRCLLHPKVNALPHPYSQVTAWRGHDVVTRTAQCSWTCKSSLGRRCADRKCVRAYMCGVSMHLYVCV